MPANDIQLSKGCIGPSVQQSQLSDHLQTLSGDHYRMFPALPTSGPYVRQIQRKPQGPADVSLRNEEKDTADA